MKRLKIAIAGAAAAALLIVPVAQAGGPQYQGRVEKDKQTVFGFDVTKVGENKRVSKVSGFLPYSCVGDESGGSAFSSYANGLHVKPDGSFAGKLQLAAFDARGGGPNDGFIKLHGKIGKHGKVSGDLSAVVVFPGMPGRGRSSLRCYTGILDWNVKRGADVTIADPPRWAP